MATEAQKRATAKYDKENTKSVLLKLNKTNDADILMMLDEVGNRQGYIKELIRKDIRGRETVLSIDSIRKMIMPVVKKYRLRKVYLFGSYANGSASPGSDVDLVIEGLDPGSAVDFVRVKDSFSKALGKEVDLVEREAMEQNKMRSGKRFREIVEKEQVLIYG